MWSAKAEAAAFTFNFCPADATCPAGLTEASLTFTENGGTADTNDYFLKAVFTGDATATGSLDAWSFAIKPDGTNVVTTPAGYTDVSFAAVNPVPSGTWAISFDNINANDCGVGAQANEVCVESTVPASGLSFTSTTLTFNLLVDLAAGISPIGPDATAQLRARFQPNGILSPGFHTASGGGAGAGGGSGAGQGVPEPATLTLLGLGMLGAAYRSRRAA
jgi:hypothetical protein